MLFGEKETDIMVGVVGRIEEVISEFATGNPEAKRFLSGRDSGKSLGDKECRQGNRNKGKYHRKGGFDAKR